MTENFIVPQERAGIELDEFLCMAYPGMNKGFMRRQVRAGAVRVDGGPAEPSLRLRADQIVMVDFDEREELPLEPVAPQGEIPVLFEDEAVIVVDKPADLAVEPERWFRDKASLSGAMLGMARSRLDGADPLTAPGAFRPRLVHRIDKDTSGAVIVAKHIEAERALRRSFEEGAIEKVYLALVEGEFPLEEGEHETIDLPIGPDRRRSGKMCVAQKGKPSRTRVAVEQRFRGYTLLRCEPLTGRTHQIRVHLSAGGFPLVVDPLYGRRDRLLLSELKTSYKPKRGRPERPLIDRLTLHAWKVTFPTPAGDGVRVHVEAPLPKDFEKALKQMSKVRGKDSGGR